MSLSATAHAHQTTHNIITGYFAEQHLCFYYSPYFGKNIWRQGTSLTGERTKKDPAFKGFRQSSSRLKEASPIAASLYKLIPKEIKQYPLYRTLTGEAIKMLKEGMEASVIKEHLKIKYIDPLLDTPETDALSTSIAEPVERERIKGMRSFTAYPAVPSGLRKIRSRRPHRVLQLIDEKQAMVGYSPSADMDPTPQRETNTSAFSNAQNIPLDAPKRKSKTTDGLVYIGRLGMCKKFKVWVRPEMVHLYTQPSAEPADI